MNYTACAGAADELMRGSEALVFTGRFQKQNKMDFYTLKENLKSILFMLLAMAGFAIEDGAIKNLANTLLVSEILILTGILGALVFAIFAKIGKEALYSKEMLAPLFFVYSLALIPLSIVASILQSVPILATLGAALWLGRSVGWALGAQFTPDFLGFRS